MPAKYLVVGTKPHVHGFIRRLFFRRLCVPVTMTIMNAYVVAEFFSPSLLRALAAEERGLLALLLTVVAGTLVHLWVYAFRTLALYRAVVVVTTADLEPPTQKGESTCNLVQET